MESKDKKIYTFIIDVDNTILHTEKVNDIYDYVNSKPFIDVIYKINGLYNSGHKIILFTSRGMRTYKGDVSLIEKYHRPILEKWLSYHQVLYHELKFGKPWGENPIYVDDRNLYVSEFLNTESNFESKLDIIW